MSDVTYRPPDILHWLEQGGRTGRSDSFRKAKEAAKSAGEGGFGTSFRKAAEAAKDLGKAAMADRAGRKYDDFLYLLADEELRIVKDGEATILPYRAIREIKEGKDDRWEIHAGTVQASIRPAAHLVVGSVKVPIGWLRNGIEVPFRLLIEELAARCGVEITGR
ncbi:MAG: hypothetical protein MH204_01270 [Fimbriimonadaceae bacterium]|nr:hypothetical protein [Fimbriimonadaceae bacterium]